MTFTTVKNQYYLFDFGRFIWSKFWYSSASLIVPGRAGIIPVYSVEDDIVPISASDVSVKAPEDSLLAAFVEIPPEKELVEPLLIEFEEPIFNRFLLFLQDIYFYPFIKYIYLYCL